MMKLKIKQIKNKKMFHITILMTLTLLIYRAYTLQNLELRQCWKWNVNVSTVALSFGGHQNSHYSKNI